MQRITLLKKIAKSIDPSIKIKIISCGDSYSIPSKKIIYLSTAKQPYDEVIQWLHYAFHISYEALQNNIDIFILLHEIGHIKTWRGGNARLQAALDSHFRTLYNKGLLTEKEYCWKYYSLPLEFLASQWAVVYWEINKKLLSEKYTIRF